MTEHAPDEQEIVKANILVHSAMAENYDVTQPHYRPENVSRVKQIIIDLAQKTGGGSLLDLGCGTGFIINIAKKYFKRVVGVDITPAMMNLVDKRDGQIELYLADTANLPLADGRFDVCTAYTFLHHLHDLRPTLSEAYRCLRHGGLFFSDQDPNTHFWKLMDNIKNRDDLSGIVAREVASVIEAPEDVAGETGLRPEEVSLAEFQKVKRGGLDPDAVIQLMRKIGYSSARFRYEWFLGQGKVFHQQPPQDAQVIETFLREALPATRNLFKYVAFYAEK